MGKNSKIKYEQKIQAVHDYINGKAYPIEIAKKLSVTPTTIYKWIQTYESFGASALLPNSKNKYYDDKTKANAVKDYLSGEGSYENIRIKYGLRSSSQLKQWIVKYNSHEESKKLYSGGNLMTKGRKTTFEERVNIVKYCIEHNNDYNETARIFKVSYQQVYSWVSKYDKSGVDGLKDRRGKRKFINEMTEVEKLRAENKLLKAKERRQQMEIDFLKKLEEIERRRS